ncbi:MAG: hypothetical protein M1503_10145 [Thaumarchaeota archaeon]|nr:hypothetical protein [Nitrososphaerota archaeon]MCL5318602.1 hypothetical protein [Nitrososphaerota archaeon]
MQPPFARTNLGKAVGDLAVTLGIRPSTLLHNGSIYDIVFDHVVVERTLKRMKEHAA